MAGLEYCVYIDHQVYELGAGVGVRLIGYGGGGCASKLEGVVALDEVVGSSGAGVSVGGDGGGQDLVCDLGVEGDEAGSEGVGGSEGAVLVEVDRPVDFSCSEHVDGW